MFSKIACHIGAVVDHAIVMLPCVKIVSNIGIVCGT